MREQLPRIPLVLTGWWGWGWRPGVGYSLKEGGSCWSCRSDLPLKNSFPYHQNTGSGGLVPVRRALFGGKPALTPRSSAVPLVHRGSERSKSARVRLSRDTTTGSRPHASGSCCHPRKRQNKSPQTPPAARARRCSLVPSGGRAVH